MEPARRLHIFVGLLVLFALATVLAVRWWGPVAGSSITVNLDEPPPTPLPVVEPLEIKAIAPETAQKINAAVPFVKGPNPAAKPFRFAGSDNDLARATDCLASAIYYEAAAEAPEGQKAVAQVVLNRVRHPAYPNTVCGVVYQGATRSTGCQFSFSCDGSMRRAPAPALWERLKNMARAMLAGTVYAPVGLATHYHTDWVSPAWSAKLDKITSERTHLFFRWNGWWGTPPAFRSRYSGGEPLVSRLAFLSPAHAKALAGELALDAGGGMPDSPTAPMATLAPAYASPAGNFMTYSISAGSNASALLAQAKAACGTQPYCKVMMWTDPAATPRALPLSESQLEKMAFSYLRNDSGKFERGLWNCQVFKRDDPAECMKIRVPVAVPLPSANAKAVTPAPPRAASASDSVDLIPMSNDEGKPQPKAVAKGDDGAKPSNLIRRRPGTSPSGTD
jgi:Cell Wall Hydrolase